MSANLTMNTIDYKLANNDPSTIIMADEFSGNVALQYVRLISTESC